MQSDLSKVKGGDPSCDSPTVHVKCRYCKADYSAPLNNATCRKCGRFASRPLLWKWKVIGIGLPLIGLIQYFVLKMHSPVAARQALDSTLKGTGIYAFIWLVSQLF